MTGENKEEEHWLTPEESQKLMDSQKKYVNSLIEVGKVISFVFTGKGRPVQKVFKEGDEEKMTWEFEVEGGKIFATGNIQLSSEINRALKDNKRKLSFERVIRKNDKGGQYLAIALKNAE